ncbi:MAG TPA: DUF4286 family protein [Flavitalea sp.]|nr:DUF4286 family protein [Flavitalea sp.]
MLIYNITSKVSWYVHEEWLRWMITTYVPRVMETGLFVKYQLVKLLDTDEIEGPTYAVQYFIENRDLYDEFVQVFADGLKDNGIALWGDQVIAFRTLMEVIN